MKLSIPLVVKASLLAGSCVAATAQAQQAVTCGTPLNLLASGPGAWSIAADGPQPDRTTPPAATPPTTGYAPALAATPLDVPPQPPADPDGYRWDPAYSWISLTPTGASAPTPYHYYVRQQIDIDPSVDLATFALNYSVSTDDELWAVYINGQQVQAGSPLLRGFGPTDPVTSYRTTATLPVTLSSGWQTGINEIVFAVYDFGGFTGFASEATSMTINCQQVPPVPPGGTVAAVPVNDWRALSLPALLMAGASFWRRKRRQ